MLFAADSGTVECAIAFFSSLYAFCHLADLRFSFFFLSFSHQARVLRAQAEPFRRRRPTLQQHPRPAPRREHRRHSNGRSFSVDGDSGSGSAAFSLPRARCLPSSLCCLSRIRGRANAPLLFFFLSTRFATSLTFVFVLFLSFSHQARVLRPKQSLSTHSPATSSPCSSTRAPSALERKISLRRRGFRQRFSSTLRQQGNFAEEHAAVALVAARKKKCAVSDKDVVKTRA